MDLGLSDKVFVLTGASRGLGFAVAQCLVADGAKVIVSARDETRVAAAVAELGTDADGAPIAYGVPADLADPDAPARLVAAAQDRFGRLDGALISAGGPTPGRASALTDDQWRVGFETVFLGSVRLARTIAAAMTGPGAIGLVLSSTAREPEPSLGLSNGLRPGLAAVAKDMASEYASRGVRVFSLLPHRIMTDRLLEVFAASGDAARARASAEASIPLGRLGEPAEFGRVATFLLSPAASYLTGIAVPVDGGALHSP